MMERDIRGDDLFREAEILCKTLRQPLSGRISDVAEIHASSTGRHAVFAGTLWGILEGAPPTRIFQIDLASGEVRALTFGPNTDRMPMYSPDGEQIAFISDRHRVGDFQLYLLEPLQNACRATPSMKGWVEYLQWSPDGRRILLGVTGHGADVSGGQGAIASKQIARDIPSWMPSVETGDEYYLWRQAWVYELDSERVWQVSCAGVNVWEAAWCGNKSIAAVVSSAPGEGHWYGACVRVIDIGDGSNRDVYTPQDQVGCPAASPSGSHLAIVEAVCSDRRIVAGDLRIIDVTCGAVQKIDTRGVDITYSEWRSDRQLLLAGHRGYEAVVGLYDVVLKTFTETWSSHDITGIGRYIAVSGIDSEGGCVLGCESFVRAPEIGVIRLGKYTTVKSFDHGYADQAKVIGAAERVSWLASDGLEIQGWLLRPEGRGPHPLVMNIHGGPVSHWRPSWLGRSALGLMVLMLLKRGYAAFFPNPRGSSGRGQGFARRVLGDVGGVDTYDFIAGLDHLVERSIADPKRLGVIGVSYGGFMTAWLITQDTRFSAAVVVAPTTNQVTQHLISNIPDFSRLFLADSYRNSGGKYFERSPIMFAHKASTPTLNICGALDRCTPPEESVQFHHALLENGVKSVLVTYPEEGHGIRKLPAVFDYVARAVGWFDQHMPSAHQG